MQGGAAFFDGPGFLHHGIVDDAYDDLAFDAEGDGDAEVGDAVEEIHGAIDGIDDPLARGGLVAGDAFFAVECIGGAGIEQDLGDEILRGFIELQFDVVVGGFIDDGELAEFFAQEFSGFERGVGG